MFFSFKNIFFIGQPKIWNMMDLVVSARMFAYHYPLDETGRTFKDYKKLINDRLVFVATSEVCFSKAFYNPDINKGSLLSIVKGGYIGNRSFNSNSLMKTESNEQLLRSNILAVSTDMETRRPKPLSGWWKKKYEISAKGFQSYTLEK